MRIELGTFIRMLEKIKSEPNRYQFFAFYNSGESEEVISWIHIITKATADRLGIKNVQYFKSACCYKDTLYLDVRMKDENITFNSIFTPYKAIFKEEN